MTRRLAVTVLVLLADAVGGGTSRAGAGTDVRWRLEREDFVHYRAVERTVEDSDERGGPRRPDVADLFGFHGYELDEAGRSVARPVTREPWLPVPFVYRIAPPRPDGTAWVAVDEVVGGTWRLAPVRARGRIVVRAVAGSAKGVTATLETSGLVRFAPEPVNPTVSSYRAVGEGRLSWTGTFDPAQGLMTRIVYDLEVRTGQGGRDLPRAVHALLPGERRWKEHVVLELDRRYERGWPGFRGSVDQAIIRCCDWLESVQEADGSFTASGTWGTTGLALLALLRSGRAATSPSVERGFRWLLAQEPRGTYETGAVLMALEAWGTPPEEMARARRGELGPPAPRTLPAHAIAYARRCADYLLAHAQTAEPGGKGPVTGRARLVRWGYPAGYEMDLEPDHPDWWDNSNTQYAVLGLNSASRLGVEVPRSTWLGVAEHLLAVQAGEGAEVTTVTLEPHAARRPAPGRRYAAPSVTARRRGWSYQECPGPLAGYGSMTGAGIASLAIARARLQDGGRRVPAALAERIDVSVRDGWAALDGMWSVLENPRFEGWYVYHLYALERAGVLGDVAVLSGHDWYWEGAVQLLLRQLPDGSWPDTSSRPHDTLWALLFLSRSTTPITPR